MREDHDLTRLRGFCQRSCKTFDARWVHRLNRIVDPEKAERTLGQGRAREEEAQSQRVKLPLAHYTQSLGRRPIDGDAQRDSAALRRSFELDSSQIDVALKPELLPDGDGSFGHG